MLSFVGGSDIVWVVIFTDSLTHSYLNCLKSLPVHGSMSLILVVVSSVTVTYAAGSTREFLWTCWNISVCLKFFGSVGGEGKTGVPGEKPMILGVSTETFSTKGNLANSQKRKKNEESWTFKSANKLVLGTWHTWLNLYFSLIQSLALKQWHKTRWNDDKWHNNELGLNPLTTWPTPQNAEWLYLKFRLGNMYHPPLPIMMSLG